MKKLTTIVAFILLFSMLLCSCNYVKDPPEESGTPSATPEETPEGTESSKYDMRNLQLLMKITASLFQKAAIGVI